MSENPKPTIIEALSAVMAAVQSVGKDQINTAPGQNYKFRGIDAVVNAVGPELRKHSVIVMPEVLEAKYRDVQTSTGKPSRECTVKVRYRFYGPAGDHLDAVAPGESMDTGDKGTAKAMSVAYRIALLQALCIPTNDPDPDSQTYERATPPTGPSPRAVELFAVIDTATSVDDLQAAWQGTVDAFGANDVTEREANQLKAHLAKRRPQFDASEQSA